MITTTIGCVEISNYCLPIKSNKQHRFEVYRIHPAVVYFFIIMPFELSSTDLWYIDNAIVKHTLIRHMLKYYFHSLRLFKTNSPFGRIQMKTETVFWCPVKQRSITFEIKAEKAFTVLPNLKKAIETTLRKLNIFTLVQRWELYKGEIFSFLILSFLCSP